MIKTLGYIELQVPALETAIHTLIHSGTIKLTQDKLLYLDIDDDFIHLVFPLLQAQFHWLQKPDYFAPDGIGAHVTVIYPQEAIAEFAEHDIGSKHFFEIIGVFTAELGNKQYYMLGVNAPTLLALRQRYHLPDKLLFKEHYVDLHITIATVPLFS